MRRTSMDPCLLARRTGESVEGLIDLQVDDYFSIDTQAFLKEAEEAATRLICKTRSFLSTDPTAFNGVNIMREDNGTITINQKDKIEKLKIPTEQKDFNS